MMTLIYMAKPCPMAADPQQVCRCRCGGLSFTIAQNQADQCEECLHGQDQFVIQVNIACSGNRSCTSGTVRQDSLLTKQDCFLAKQDCPLAKFRQVHRHVSEPSQQHNSATSHATRTHQQHLHAPSRTSVFHEQQDQATSPTLESRQHQGKTQNAAQTSRQFVDPKVVEELLANILKQKQDDVIHESPPVEAESPPVEAEAPPVEAEALPQAQEPCEYDNDSGFDSGSVHASANQVNEDEDVQLSRLNRNNQELARCFFYYGPINNEAAKGLLQGHPVGTFLLRDSSDHRYLYSLSVRTNKGTTSIRIIYSNGLFQFDSHERIRHKLPQFHSVLSLIDFHVQAIQDGAHKRWRWEDFSGSRSLDVELKMPLRKSVPSLAHLSRLQVNQARDSEENPQVFFTRLPRDFQHLEDCLLQYPYKV